MLPEKCTTYILVTKVDYEFQIWRKLLLAEMNRAGHGFTKASVKVVMVVHVCDPST